MSGSSTSAISEGMLTENLKTLRVLHQLLMVVAAAILVFALRVDRSRDYRAVLDELRAMQDLNFGGWITFVRDRYKTYGNQNDEFVRDIVKLAGVPLHVVSQNREGECAMIREMLILENPIYSGAPLKEEIAEQAADNITKHILGVCGQ